MEISLIRCKRIRGASHRSLHGGEFEEVPCGIELYYEACIETELGPMIIRGDLFTESSADKGQYDVFVEKIRKTINPDYEVDATKQPQWVKDLISQIDAVAGRN